MEEDYFSAHCVYNVEKNKKGFYQVIRITDGMGERVNVENAPKAHSVKLAVILFLQEELDEILQHN